MTTIEYSARLWSEPAPSVPVPARDGASREEIEADLRRAKMALIKLLEDTLPERFRDPEWYLTGVQVGLASLARLHAASHMVYRNGNDRGVGARKVANLGHVFQRLEDFDRADNHFTRARIFIEHKDSFEDLLMDFEESEQSLGFQSEHLTIIEQVAKDVKRACNRLRTLENLAGAIHAIPRVSWLHERGLLKGKRRAAALDELLETYRAALERYGITEVAQMAPPPKLQTVHRRVKDEMKRMRRHVAAIRDEMYRDKRNLVSSPASPEDDLETTKVITFLRGTSRAGLEYLLRAYSAYAHAAEGLAGGPALLAEIRSIKQQLEENEPLTEPLTAPPPSGPVFVKVG